MPCPIVPAPRTVTVCTVIDSGAEVRGETRVDGLDRAIDLGLGVVEVRRHANAGLRPMIDDHVSRQQRLGDPRAVWHVDDDTAPSLAIFGRRVETPAAPLG